MGRGIIIIRVLCFFLRSCVGLSLVAAGLFLRELMADMRLWSVADKFRHAVAYGCLAWALMLIVRRLTFRRFFWILVAVMVIGGADEASQPLWGRSCDALDWLANIAGAGVAGAAWMLMHRYPGQKAPDAGEGT